MEYFEISELISSHCITYTASTRKWFLKTAPGNAANVWTGLAGRRFYNHTECELQPIPVIELEDYRGDDARFNRAYSLPEGRLLDYFSLGLRNFVSSRLKQLLEENEAEAFFTEASVTIEEEQYLEPFFLVAPRDMLPVFDEEQSVFMTCYDTSGESSVGRIDTFVLKTDEIPAEQKLFYLHINGGYRPLMLRSDIVEHIRSAGITGMKFTPVNEMKRPF